MTQDIVERFRRSARIHADMNAVPLEETQDWKDAAEIEALRKVLAGHAEASKLNAQSIIKRSDYWQGRAEAAEAERDDALAQLAAATDILRTFDVITSIPTRARDMLEVRDAAVEETNIELAIEDVENMDNDECPESTRHRGVLEMADDLNVIARKRRAAVAKLNARGE